MNENVDEMLGIKEPSSPNVQISGADPQGVYRSASGASEARFVGTDGVCLVLEVFGCIALLIGIGLTFAAVIRDSSFDDTMNVLAGILVASTGVGMLAAGMLGRVLITIESNTHRIGERLEHIQSRQDTDSQ